MEKGGNPMKKYGIGLCIAAVLLAGIVYGSYRYSLYKLDNIDLSGIGDTDPSGNEFLTVDTIDQDRITNTTKYVLEHYNATDFSLKEEQKNIPAEFVGKTREELIEYLKTYEEAPPIEDLEEGLTSFELISFSKDRIVLRKTFQPPAKDYKYYLIEENGYITVYYMDKKTVYEYTDIQVEILPEEIQKKIKSGNYITDIQQLYNFLENYSS